jgi:hypothetical protein
MYKRYRHAWLPSVLCLLLFHSADGNPLWIRTAAITVLQLARNYHDHVAKGAQVLVFTVTGKTFGVRESEEEVARIVRSCEKEP